MSDFITGVNLNENYIEEGGNAIEPRHSDPQFCKFSILTSFWYNDESFPQQRKYLNLVNEMSLT